MELLKNVDPKEYEKYARMYGITDFRGLLQAFELLKQSQEEETHRLVWSFVYRIILKIYIWNIKYTSFEFPEAYSCLRSFNVT